MKLLQKYSARKIRTNIELNFNTDNNPGFYSLSFGKKINNYRIEFNYANATLKGQDLSVVINGIPAVATIVPKGESEQSSYMIYGYKYFPSDTKVSPYFGIGLGVGSFKTNDAVATINGVQLQLIGLEESLFSYALKAGVDYKLNDKTALYTETTYQNFASYRWSEPGFNPINYNSTHYFGISSGIKFFF